MFGIMRSIDASAPQRPGRVERDAAQRLREPHVADLVGCSRRGARAARRAPGEHSRPRSRGLRTAVGDARGSAAGAAFGVARQRTARGGARGRRRRDGGLRPFCPPSSSSCFIADDDLRPRRRLTADAAVLSAGALGQKDDDGLTAGAPPARRFAALAAQAQGAPPPRGRGIPTDQPAGLAHLEHRDLDFARVRVELVLVLGDIGLLELAFSWPDALRAARLSLSQQPGRRNGSGITTCQFRVSSRARGRRRRGPRAAVGAQIRETPCVLSMRARTLRPRRRCRG